MCGIAGILDRQGAQPGVARMLAQMHHRGPDHEGAWATRLDDGRELALGHRRLSILDRSAAGHQPMVDAGDRYALSYNGEIYNYLEVAAELREAGVTFRSHCDTEVLLEAYKHWGSACLERLNGMFAFALYDGVRGVLFCARDRYGEKPFLYGGNDHFFAFASEYKALLQHPGLSLEHDETRLVASAYQSGTGLDSDRQTVFDDVQQLLPGEAMEVDVHTLQHKTWRYWQIRPGQPRPVADEREVFAHFRELLVDAVRVRMRSDVAVGSCLSGGLDSSAIVCIARQLLGDDRPYHAFTGRFPGTHADEWQWAEHAIDAAGVTSHVVEPTVDGFVDEIGTFLWYNELPVGSSSQYAQWNVFRLARQHDVTVLLDGQGADETLGGYEQYFRFYVEALRAADEHQRLARELPAIRDRYPLALKPRARALRDRLPFRLRHAMSNRAGIGTNMLYGLPPRRARQLARQPNLPQRQGFDPLASALNQDTFQRSLTTLLRYGDRNSMAHSREVRLPFCDHRIAEFVAGLPPQLLMGEVQTKRLLRESMRGILPEPIRTRWNKQGFRPPQDQWFQAPKMLELARDTFSSTAFRNDPWWIAPWWLQALERVEQGELALGWTLWKPLMVAQWKQHFLEPLRATRRQKEAA